MIEHRRILPKKILLHGVILTASVAVFCLFTERSLVLAVGVFIGVGYTLLTVLLSFRVVEQFIIGEARKTSLVFLLVPIKLPAVLLLLYLLFKIDPMLVLGFLLGMVVLLSAPLALARKQLLSQG